MKNSMATICLALYFVLFFSNDLFPVMASQGETELLTPVEIRVWDGDFGKDVIWLSFDGQSSPLTHHYFSSKPKAILFFLRSKGKYQLKWRHKRGASSISGPEIVEETRDIFVRDQDGFVSISVRGSLFSMTQQPRAQYNPYYNPNQSYPDDYPPRFERGKL